MAYEKMLLAGLLALAIATGAQNASAVNWVEIANSPKPYFSLIRNLLDKLMHQPILCGIKPVIPTVRMNYLSDILIPNKLLSLFHPSSLMMQMEMLSALKRVNLMSIFLIGSQLFPAL